MKLYAVRKCRGQWSIIVDEKVVLEFDSYDEAIRTARSAADVLSNCKPQASESTGAVAFEANVNLILQHPG